MLSILSIFLLSLPACQTFVPQNATTILSSNIPDGSPKKLVFLGASSEYGTGSFDPEYQSYVSLIAMYLYFENLPYEVINAGVPGDTTGGVLDRLDRYLNDQTAMIFLHIGGNDIGITQNPLGPYPPLENFKQGLEAIVKRISAKGIPLVLVRSNFPEATEFLHRFVAIYDEMARKYQLPMIDYWAPGVIFGPGMQVPDGHANENGHRRIARFVLHQLNLAFNPSEDELLVSNQMMRILPWFVDRWEKDRLQ